MSIQVRSNEKPEASAPEAKAEGSLSQVSQSNDKSAPEEDSSEQKDSESDTENTEESGESDDTDAGRESETEDENEAKEKPKKKGGFQRRIDKLNARYSQTQQELEYWKKMAMETAGSSKKEAPIDSQKPAAADGKPSPDHFDTHAEYVEALTDWKTEQKLRERDQKAEESRLKTEQAKVVETYNEKAKAFAKAHPDFQETLAEVDGVAVSLTIRQSILESEHGPALAYELAKNVDELERISALGPIAAAREIGKIEARIAAKSSDQKTDTKKVTNAPKPLAPVKSGAATVKKSISDPSLSQREYEQLRMEQLKKRRQG